MFDNVNWGCCSATENWDVWVSVVFFLGTILLAVLVRIWWVWEDY